MRILATCQEIARDAEQVGRIVAEERELASATRAATNGSLMVMAPLRASAQH